MPAVSGSPEPAAWPLTGRSEELAYVRGVRRGEDPPSVLVLGGAQGVGKSRFAQEALAEARAERWLTERIDGAAATSAVPFGAIAHLAPPEAAHDPLRLLVSTADHLAQRAARRPLMVLVDDAHQLDEASLAVLRRVATVPRLFLLLTIRSDVPVPAPLVALWKDNLAHRVELQPLSRDETYSLVTAVLRAGVDPAALRWYWDNTLGNPLYLRELLLADHAGATLREVGGTWARTEHGRGDTRRLRELVQSRLGRIDPAWLPALEALSLTGPLPAEAVAGLAPEGGLDRLIEQGLLTAHGAEGGRSGAAGSVVVHLAHPIYGVVLRDGLDPVRAERLRRQVLDALDARPDRSPSEIVRLVTLRLDHGVEVDTPQLVTAARYAQAAFSQAVAERLRVGSSDVDRITAAVADAGSSAPPSEDDLASAERLATAAWERDRAQAAGLALTTILVARGKAGAAEKLVTELEARADAPADRAQLALARAALLFWVRGRTDEALDVLRRAEATSVDADAIRRLQRLRAGIALNVGQVGEAVDVATQLMDAAGPSEPFGALAAATAAAGLALAGRPHEAIAIVDAHLAVAQANVLDIPEAVGQLLLARVYAARVLGDLDGAEWFAYACYQTAADHGALGAMAVFVGALGQIALDRGRPLTATRRLREAEVLLRERDSFGYRPLVMAHLTMALAQSGVAPGDGEPLPQPGPAAGHERFFDPDLLLADAWRLAADGRLDPAVHRALEAAERAGAAGLAPAEALALHAVVRFGEPARVAPRARELAAAVGSPLLDACAAHAAAAAAADGEGLDEVAAAFAGLGARLLAAEAAAAAAVIHDGQDNPGAAHRSRSRSRALAEDCEGATTPALRLARREPLLTTREHEVAVLATGGLTSKAIAERLVVSPRTVESHMYRIFAKLGVENRSQLADVLDLEAP